MPIYDYVCGACGHRFEVFRGLSEAGPHQCPVCGGPVSRVFAPPTIVFKGSGWAKKDRRFAGSPKKKTTEGEGSGAETPAGADASGGTEPKAGGTKSTPATEPKAGGTKPPAATTAASDD